jgi:hypothetical protein
MEIENTSKLKENFKRRNIEVEFFETLEEVKAYILNAIPIESTVGIGHSITLQNINMTNALLARGNIVFDKELAKDKEECKSL